MIETKKVSHLERDLNQNILIVCRVVCKECLL